MGRDRAGLMAAMLERVAGSGLNETLKHLLVNVIKTYFVLTAEDAESYRRLIERKEFRAVQEVELTWADKLIEKGREQGREEGREEGLEAGVIEGKRRTLVRQLSAKFGDLPEEITIRAETMSESELDSILDRLLTATTLDELQIG
ncbi:MAG TPA: DUF4351 domain-containing protein [Vicinamibacteria bacterium]